MDSGDGIEVGRTRTTTPKTLALGRVSPASSSADAGGSVSMITIETDRQFG